MSKTVAVAVVGGGVAGLAAAHVLAANRVPFLVLEAGPRWGGLIHTEEAGGFLLEGGPDAILATKPEGVELCRTLGLSGELIPTNTERRTVWVRHRGRLHPLPEGMVLGVPTRLRPLLASRLFSWPGKLRLALEPLVPARRDGGDESLADFVRRRLGSEAVERVGQPLLAGIHAGDAERLSASATFPRLVEMERTHGSLRRGLSAGAPASSFYSPFYSLRRGLGTLVGALVGGLPAPALRLGAAVRTLIRESEHFRLVLDGGEEVRARVVILAVPAPAAAPLVAPCCPAAGTILAGLRYASTVTVLLGYRREDVRHPLDGYGFVCVSGDRRLAACTFLSTKLPGRAPEGHVLLRAFFGGTPDPQAVDLDDDALVWMAEDELRPLLGITGKPALSRVYRWPHAMPQMEVGHGERMAALERALAAVPGLFLTGGGLRGTGIPDTVADAQRAARGAS